MEKGLVSIITPVYNAEKFISKTIESVVNQTYKNWELILIDDGSSDQSVSLIHQWQLKHKNIHCIQLSKNSGAAVARNVGISAARGQYIAFIDSDDWWLENKLLRQINFMRRNHYGFSYTNFALINEKGEIVKEKVKMPILLDYKGLLKNTAIACSTVVINREAIGDFRMPLVRKGQDTATWLMLMRGRKIKAHGLDEVLNYYRQVNNSLSSNKFAALKRTWHTYYHLEKLPLMKALYYFSYYIMNAIKRRC